MKHTKLVFAFALALTPLAVLTSAPVPKDKLHLTPAGKVKVDKLVANDAAFIDENRLVIVGRKGGVDDTDENGHGIALFGGEPKGVILDLTKKSVQPFVSQHTQQIRSVSFYGRRLITSSSSKDSSAAVLGSLDLTTHDTREIVQFDDAASCQVRSFHKSDKVVMNATKQLLVFSPSKPKKRLEPPSPAGVEFVSSPLAVSADDAWIACSGGKDQVVCFEVATKKATVVSIAPRDAAEEWGIHDLVFSPSGKLFVCRFGGPVPDKPEDVPADRRGLVRIDLPEGKVVPLNMERSASTSSCAINGKETLLVTLGLSKSEKQADGYAVELRVYNLTSGKLVYRQQLDGEGYSWFGFTPSGKRLVCVARDGVVRWWDVP